MSQGDGANRVPEQPNADEANNVLIVATARIPLLANGAIGDLPLLENGAIGDLPLTLNPGDIDPFLEQANNAHNGRRNNRRRPGRRNDHGGGPPGGPGNGGDDAHHIDPTLTFDSVGGLADHVE